jgi:hypothetical protein
VLVIRGEVDISNDKPRIVVEENGILIILGDLLMGNKTVLENDGILAIDGTLAYGTPSEKAVYIGGEGAFLFLPDGPPSVDPDDLPLGNEASNAALDFDQLCDPETFPIPGFDADNDPEREVLDAICIFITTGGINPLPVSLISFTGMVDNGLVRLEWQTAAETNNDYFSVSRSIDGKHFQVIGEVRGHGTTAETNAYSHLDRYPPAGRMYYRLTQTDFDGSTSELGTISVSLATETDRLKIFPNPLTGREFSVLLSRINEGTRIEIQVSDLLGRIIFNRSVVPGSKSHPIANFTMEDHLQSGTYIVTIREGSSIKRGKIIKN